MPYITLYDITRLLTNFGEKYPAINEVLVDNELDFSGGRQHKYPIINYEVGDLSYAGDIATQSYLVTIADIMSENFKGENVNPIIDDCQRIGNDIITFFDNMFELDINSPTFNPFEESTPDRIAGITFNLQVSYYRYADNCWLGSLEEAITDYFSYQMGYSPTDDILSPLQYSTQSLKAGELVGNFTSTGNEPYFFIFKEPVTEPIKRKWYVTGSNSGNIDSFPEGTNLFYWQEVNGYRYYITNYLTAFPDNPVRLLP